MMKTVKLKNLDNAPIKVPTDDRPCPPHLPQPHFLCGVIGSRGSGKTTMLVNWIKKYDESGCFDKLYFFSPTIKADPKVALLYEGKHSYEPHVYDDFNNRIFQEVLAEIDADIDEYRQYEDHNRVWKKYVRVGGDPDRLSIEDLVQLELMGFEPPPPTKFGRKPYSLLVFDDLAGNKDLYRADAKGLFNKFVIAHRHRYCSLILLQQLHANGIPRQIRNNLSCMVLFRNKNENVQKAIAQEYGGFVDQDTFMRMWDFACQQPFEFFMVDSDAKIPSHRFRKNFDTLLLVEDHKKKMA